jgi:ABC-2 type transport system ATP-binding protein
MELVTDQPTLALGQLVKNGFSDAALFGNRIHVFSHQPESDEECISQMLSEVGINLNSVALRPLSMEDVFVYRVTLLENQELLMAKGGR